MKYTLLLSAQKLVRILRQKRKAILGLVVSAVLLFVSLWQLEIVEICISEGRDWDWPFYILPPLKVWIARDMFFSLIVIAFILEGISLWYLLRKKGGQTT
jgi:hypothetical protein